MPERDLLRCYSNMIHLLTTAIHELLGHGSGKLLSETSLGVYNFDRDNHPSNPITGKAVETLQARANMDQCVREAGNYSGGMQGNVGILLPCR